MTILATYVHAKAIIHPLKKHKISVLLTTKKIAFSYAAIASIDCTIKWTKYMTRQYIFEPNAVCTSEH